MKNVVSPHVATNGKGGAYGPSRSSHMTTYDLGNGESYTMAPGGFGAFKLSDGHTAELVSVYEVKLFSMFIWDMTLCGYGKDAGFADHVRWIRVAGTLEQYHAWRAARRIGAI